MKELNLALKELRNGAEIILLERKDPAYFQHWFEEWWIPLYWNDVQNSLDNQHQITYIETMKKIYEEIVKDLLAYRGGSLHPFVSKNTKRGSSWDEPTVAHFQKLLNKYDKLAKDSKEQHFGSIGWFGSIGVTGLVVDNLNLVYNTKKYCCKKICQGTYRLPKRVLHTKNQNYEKLKRSTQDLEVVIWHLCVVKIQFQFFVFICEPTEIFF